MEEKNREVQFASSGQPEAFWGEPYSFLTQQEWLGKTSETGRIRKGKKTEDVKANIWQHFETW